MSRFVGAAAVPMHSVQCPWAISLYAAPTNICMDGARASDCISRARAQNETVIPRTADEAILCKGICNLYRLLALGSAELGTVIDARFARFLNGDEHAVHDVEQRCTSIAPSNRSRLPTPQGAQPHACEMLP